MNAPSTNPDSKQLERKKVSLERNRNICAMVIAFFCYNLYVSFEQGTPSIWFCVAMGLLILACAALALYEHRLIKKINAELSAIASASLEDQSAEES